MRLDRRGFLTAASLMPLWPSMPSRAGESTAPMTGRTAWTFRFDGLDGQEINLADHAGRPVLVVNTASFCGFASQLSSLQALWTLFGPRGLLIVGVPSGDFGGQEAAGAAEIRQAADQHGVTFPMAAKTHVTGREAHPFYRWAVLQPPREAPRWNFHKYLVGSNGDLAASFGTAIDPSDSRLGAAIGRQLGLMG